MALDLTDREITVLRLLVRERTVGADSPWMDPVLASFTDDEWAALARKLEAMRDAQS